MEHQDTTLQCMHSFRSLPQCEICSKKKEDEWNRIEIMVKKHEYFQRVLDEEKEVMRGIPDVLTLPLKLPEEEDGETLEEYLRQKLVEKHLPTLMTHLEDTLD